MPTSLYNFQYVPLTGRLPGKSFVSQTEQAINGLAQYVYDNSTNYEAVKAIAQKAEEDSSSALEYSEEALDKAQTALETVGRAYIKTTSAVDLNDYFDSELLVILSTASTNLPASISGYLTVMSSDTHDYCMQVYIGIDGSVYKRTATISNNTPTFGAWSETPITLSSLQTILTDYAKVDASNIGVNAQTDNSVAWGNAIGGGEIAEDEQRLITGGTVYPLSQNVEQNTSNIATNTADIVQNTGGISANSKRITNIEKLLQGNLYDYQTDSTSAYTKSVPSGAMPYAGLEKVGGKTVVFNQLCQNGDFASASGWVPSNVSTMSLGIADNIATITVTSALNSRFSSLQRNVTSVMKTGHKVYVCADVMPTATGGATSMGITDSTPTYNNTQAIGGGWYHYEVLLSIQDSTSHRLEIYLTRVATDDYASVAVGETMKVKNVKFFDLTQMFGAGNEPSTVAEFESMFPASYYPYNEGELLSAGVTSVVSQGYNLFDKSTAVSGYFLNEYGNPAPSTISAYSDYISVIPSTTYYFSSAKIGGKYRWFEYDFDKNIIALKDNPNSGAFTVGSATRYVRVNLPLADLDTCVFNVSSTTNGTYKPYKAPISYSIPASIRALTGYGWSAGTAYNYVDFERKVFVKNVGAVDLGSLTWQYSDAPEHLRFIADITDIKPQSSQSEKGNLIVNGYVTYILPDVYQDLYDKSCAVHYVNHSIWIYDSGYTDATAFKNAMNGVYAYYELDTPQEIDISEYITDDNLIQVEAGGTLTVPNSNGTDYQIPVPSEETYMIDLQSAIGG